MRNLDKLYQELQEIEEEMRWVRKKDSHIYKNEWNNLLCRKRNIYVNINQIKQMKGRKMNEMECL